MTTLTLFRSKPLAANRRRAHGSFCASVARKPTTCWGRYLLALVSCVSILQLPVPVLHRHSEFESAEVMAEHLGTRHRQSAPPMELSHWHFVMPREINREHDCDKDKPTTDTAIACLGGASSFSAVFDSLAAGKLACLPMVMQVAGLIATPAKIVPQQTHPLAALRPTVRACAVLCVIRC